MSTVDLTILFLVLFSTISARLPPKVVYSAVIHNADDSSVQCNIIWLTPTQKNLNSGLFTIGQGKYYSVQEKRFSMDNNSWVARGTIQKIDCGNNLVLAAPFDGVDSPKTNWEFRVEAGQIVSVGPSSYLANE